MSDLIHSLQQLDPGWVYGAIFLFAFIENLFPPSPSDMIVVFGGALAAMDKGSFGLTLCSATAGSLLGFMAMYAVGRWLGNYVLERKRVPFLPIERMNKIGIWFAKYGYWLIIGNRFLAGTRAIVSLFAGVSRLDLVKTSLLSFVSSLVWNLILVYAGYSLGNHWEQIESYLRTYSQVVTIIVITIALGFVVRYLYKKRRGQKS